MKTTSIRRQFLVRSTDARPLIDTFLVAAVIGVLGVRSYLHIAGYPQLGHGAYHIAHMLWGGLLMLAAIVVSLSFFGRRLMVLVAVIGGLGFGIFIDEVGKFITSDNNYFFQPSIGIIYATLILVYLTSILFEKVHVLTDEEYKLNALRLMEDALRNDLDPQEKREIHRLLVAIKHRDAVTKLLETFLEKIETIEPPRPSRLQKTKRLVHRRYQQFWQLRYTNTSVKLLFAGLILLTVFALFSNILVNIHSLNSFLFGRSPGDFFLKGQLVATGLSLFCLIVGLALLAKSRVLGFRWFYVATLINILLTQFFVFARYQFVALWLLVLQIVLLGLIRLVLTEEGRV